MQNHALNGRLSRSQALLAAALICVGWTSCFRGYDLSKVKCAKKADCPNGYHCDLLPQQPHGLCVAGNDTDGSRATESDAKKGEDVVAAKDGLRDGVAGGSGGGRQDAGQDGAGGSGGQTASGGTEGVDAPAGGSGGTAVGGESGGGETTGGVTSTGDTGGVISTGGATANTNPDAPVAPPDAGAAKGARCNGNGDCANNLCVDGFCCDKACSGCYACANSMTGEPDGTCAPVSVGNDPHKTCDDETAASPAKPCGNDGNCDGKGACRKVGEGQKCGADSCNTEGTAFTPAPKCDGKGTCVPGTAQACAPYDCAVTGCKKTCSTQEQCDTKTSYCDTTAGLCVTKKTNGTAAVKGHEYECTSGLIADGVCCDKACTDVCTACTATLNGHEASTTGSCMAVTASKADPRGVCEAVSDPCGQDGTCNGSGACRYRAAVDTDCGTPSCNSTTSMITKSTCNNSHTCLAGAAAACPGAMACASTTACKTGSCVSANDCASGHFCASGGVCTPKYDDGHSCTAGADVQCRNGNCVGTTCCSTPCGECRTCANSTGTCVANAAANGTPCGTGVCNNGTCSACTAGVSCPAPAGEECWNHATDCSTGTSVCKKTTANNGIECGDGPSCSGTTRSYGHWICQAGTCAKPTTYTTCPSTGCNTSTGLCNAACSSSQTACGSACCPSSTQYCNASNVCANKLAAGGACPYGNECQSGAYCVSGTCCESASCGHDQTCSSGRCACKDLTFTCGGCGTWTFGTGTEGWTAIQGGGPVGVSASGGRLAISVSVTGSDQFAFWVPICNSGSAFLYNYVLTADVTISNSEMAYAVMFGMTFVGGISDDTSDESLVLTPGLSSPIRVTLSPDKAAEGVGFGVLTGGPWTGTIYLDNVRVSAP